MTYEWISPLKDEQYDDYINRLLNVRANIKDVYNYQELHHIKPRCVGGTNEKENLIYLYAEEHYCAHKILANEHPENDGLQLAWWIMCSCDSNGRAYIVTPEDFAVARQRAASIKSKRVKEQVAQGTFKGSHRAVVCLETLQSYDSAKAAGDAIGKSRAAITQCCLGNNLTAGNLHWCYADEYSEELRNQKLKLSFEHNRKPVICLETQQIYNSACEASKITHVYVTNIIRCCNHIEYRHTAGGYHWEYYKGENIGNVSSN